MTLSKIILGIWNLITHILFLILKKIWNLFEVIWSFKTKVMIEIRDKKKRKKG